MTCRGQIAQDRMGIMNWCRHQFRGFVGRIAEHDPLIPCAVVIDALGDVGGLFVQVVFTQQVFPMESVLFVPNFTHNAADD